MTFQPVIPLTGYTGWRFLTRTLDQQQQAYTQSAPVARATTYFRENIAKARTVDDLMADRRLLEVALGAFGLSGDINNTAFIRKVLSEGTLNEDAFANRLADKRYAALARTFGFGDLGARTGLPRFPDQIIARFETQRFQEAVGQQNGDMRLALGLSQGLTEVLDSSSSDTARWFAMMGNAPLRKVFETAFGLPSSFGRIDLDQQLEGFRSRAQSLFGTDKLADFTDPAIQEKMIRLFLVRSELQTTSATSSASIVLSLLRGG